MKIHFLMILAGCYFAKLQHKLKNAKSSEDWYRNEADQQLQIRSSRQERQQHMKINKNSLYKKLKPNYKKMKRMATGSTSITGDSNTGTFEDEQQLDSLTYLTGVSYNEYRTGEYVRKMAPRSNNINWSSENKYKSELTKPLYCSQDQFVMNIEGKFIDGSLYYLKITCAYLTSATEYPKQNIITSGYKEQSGDQTKRKLITYLKTQGYKNDIRFIYFKTTSIVCKSGYSVQSDNVCYSNIQYCISQNKNKCTQCKDKYYNSNEKCLKRTDVPNCIEYNGNQCSKCLVNFQLYEKKCYVQVSECLEYDDNGCSKCADGNLAQSGFCYKIIEECSQQIGLNCEKCNDGFYIKDNECFKKTKYCDLQGNDGSCSQCNKGFALSSTGQCEVTNCSYKDSDGKCINCKIQYNVDLTLGVCFKEVQNCQVQQQDICTQCYDYFKLEKYQTDDDPNVYTYQCNFDYSSYYRNKKIKKSKKSKKNHQ